MSDRQVAYAARDAWSSAAIVQVLESLRLDVFSPDILLEKVLNTERSIQDMDVRSKTRRAAKLELKAIKVQEEEYNNTQEQIQQDGNSKPIELVSKKEKDRLW